MIRIILTGPHSCGKTTLANELIRRWDELFPESKPSLLSEVARNVMRTRGFTRGDISSIEFQKAILEAQVEAESTIMRPFVSDRCLLDPIAYTLYKNAGVDGSNHRMLATLPAVQSFLASYRDSTETLIILLEPVKEFAQDDGIRSQVGSWEDWMECNRCFKAILRDTGMRWSTLGPETVDLGARVEKVKVLLKDAIRRRG